MLLGWLTIGRIYVRSTAMRPNNNVGIFPAVRSLLQRAGAPASCINKNKNFINIMYLEELSGGCDGEGQCPKRNIQGIIRHSRSGAVLH